MKKVKQDKTDELNYQILINKSLVEHINTFKEVLDSAQHTITCLQESNSHLREKICVLQDRCDHVFEKQKEARYSLCVYCNKMRIDK